MLLTFKAENFSPQSALIAEFDELQSVCEWFSVTRDDLWRQSEFRVDAISFSSLLDSFSFVFSEGFVRTFRKFNLKRRVVRD